MKCRVCHREIEEDEYNEDFDKCEDCAFLEYDKQPVKEITTSEWMQ